MANYRAYIFAKDGHRFAKIEDFPSDLQNDAAAINAAKKRVDKHEVELWDAGRLICRFSSDKERLQTLKDFTVARVFGVPSITAVDTAEELAE
jgi:hypothetical protein